MGTALLKRKAEVNYRKKKKNETMNCGNCANSLISPVFGIGNTPLGNKMRCPIIGWGASVRFNITEKHVCNCWSLKK